MKHFILISFLLFAGAASPFAQVITSEKATIKFNNKEKTSKTATPIQSENNATTESSKPPGIELINITVGQGEVIKRDENKLNLIGKLSTYNQRTVLYLNNREIAVNESGFFNIDHELTIGINEISLKAVSEARLISEISFKVDYQPKVTEVLPGAGGRYYALIIGINSYSDPLINGLDRPIKDAETFYEVITSRYTFEKNNIKLIRNATMAEIVDALDYFAGIVKPVDNFLIFYAGHGVWDATSEIGFWLPSDARKSSKLAWFRNSTLRDYLREIKSKHTLLISDACFAGSIFKTRSAFMDATVAINRLYELPSRKAMTSGTLTEVPDQSVFLKYMIDRLQNNFDKYLSSEQLFGKFRMAVINNSNALPQLMYKILN